jgi:hypothetical protein
MKRETKRNEIYQNETKRNEIYRKETEWNKMKCTQKLEGNAIYQNEYTETEQNRISRNIHTCLFQARSGWPLVI